MEKSEINVIVEDVSTFVNDEYSGITIQWYGNIGWGEYTLYRTTNDPKWHADSECMDSNSDKNFIKKLLEDFIDQLEVDG